MNREKMHLALVNNFQDFVDVTLREGEQFRRVEFSTMQGTKLLQHLKTIGIDRAEVPNPITRGMREYIQSLLIAPNTPRLFTHIRTNISDLKATLDLNINGEDIQGVHILGTAKLARIQDMGLTQSEYIDRMSQMIKIAHSRNLEVKVGLEHAWDVKFSDALKIFRMCDDLKVHRVNVADTRGSATHHEVGRYVRCLAKELKHAKISVHIHSDCGGEIANPTEAVLNGASFIETTVLGIGERFGITPLSRMLARFANLAPEITTRYNTREVSKVEEYVSEVIDYPIPFNYPSAGLVHKAGIHLSEIARRGVGTYEAYDVELFCDRNFDTTSRISGKVNNKINVSQ